MYSIVDSREAIAFKLPAEMDKIVKLSEAAISFVRWCGFFLFFAHFSEIFSKKIIMAVSKARKVEQLAEIEALIKDAKSIGFTSNQKITVGEVTNIKKELRAQDAVFITAKKTLIRLAFKNVLNLDLDIDTLPGQVAMVVAKGDAIAPLGIVNKFANEKDWKKAQKLTFVGGYFEEKLVDADAIKKIAGLPSREVLLAKLLGSMMSPLSGLARFFDAAKKDLEAKSLEKVSDLTVDAPAKTEEKTEKVEEKKEEPKTEEKVEATPEKTEKSEEVQAPTHRKNEEANEPKEDKTQDGKNEEPSKTKADGIQSPEAFEKAKKSSDEDKAE